MSRSPMKELLDAQSEAYLEWIKQERMKLLEQWDRAVKLWDSGELFNPQNVYPDRQREYAEICVSWLVPNGFVEPHVLAHDMPENCDCFHCILGL